MWVFGWLFVWLGISMFDKCETFDDWLSVWALTVRLGMWLFWLVRCMTGYMGVWIRVLEWVVMFLFVWLTVWLTDWLTNRLTDWLTNRLTDWLAGWLAICLAGWLAGWECGCLAGYLPSSTLVWPLVSHKPSSDHRIYIYKSVIMFRVCVLL